MFAFNVYNPANRADFSDWETYSDNGITLLELRCHLEDHIGAELLQKVCTVIENIELFRMILQLFTVLDLEYFFDESTWRIIARNIYMLGCGSSTETAPKQTVPKQQPDYFPKYDSYQATEHLEYIPYVPNLQAARERGLEAVFAQRECLFPDTPESVWSEPYHIQDCK